MIMPCMNCTSAGETGGNVGRVSGGNVFVGCPGAPGWTTTGCASCAETERGNKHARAQPAIKQKGFIGPETSDIEAPTLPQSAPKRRDRRAGIFLSDSFAPLRGKSY